MEPTGSHEEEQPAGEQTPTGKKEQKEKNRRRIIRITATTRTQRTRRMAKSAGGRRSRSLIRRKGRTTKQSRLGCRWEF